MIGSEWDLYAASKALRSLDFTFEEGHWTRDKPLHKGTLCQINHEIGKVFGVLGSPTITTRCGLCREVGHWRTTCPAMMKQKQETLRAILQDKRYKRYCYKQCMCGPTHYPSICLYCKHACCDQAYQPVAYLSHFTCPEHGETRQIGSLRDL